MNILVIGGVRFFGKKLVIRLLEAGHDVTVVSRGNYPLPQFENLSHLKTDRDDLAAALKGESTHWDVVYDQISYCSNDAKASLDAIQSRADKLVLASSMAVYDAGPNRIEADFDPFHFSYKMGARDDFSYAEGKQHAEAYFCQNTDMPLIFARIPFVMGIQDYSERLVELVRAVVNQQSIYVPAMDAQISMIDADDVASALFSLAQVTYKGAINVLPRVPISVRSIIEQIENTVARKAIVTGSPSNALVTDYFSDADRFGDPSLLESLGLDVRSIDQWMGPLIEEINNA